MNCFITSLASLVMVLVYIASAHAILDPAAPDVGEENFGNHEPHLDFF